MRKLTQNEGNRMSSADINKRQSPIGRTNYPSSHKSQQNRLVEYQYLAQKAKQQLKQFEYKRKPLPQQHQSKVPQNQRQGTQTSNHDHLQRQQHRNQKSLAHTYSQKILRKDLVNDEGHIRRDQKIKVESGEGKPEKLSADLKMESPKKNKYIDSQEYKKLHEKLDLIQNKITDMKRNLQKKKEEKQKNQHKAAEEAKKNGLKDLVTKVSQQSKFHTFNSNPYSPRHNIYYVSEVVRAYKDQQSLAREHLVNSLNILKILEKSKRMSDNQVQKQVIRLPRKKGYQDKKTIIFDLDETLIHCNDTINTPHDAKLPIKFPTGQVIEAGINVRPYTKQLLSNLSKYFQLIIFTASHACYANVVVDYLDPKRQWVHHRLFRQNCTLSGQGMYIKDLRVVDRDLSRTVLVDNAAYSYAFQLGNGIPILPYYKGNIDFELKMLEEYLLKLLFVDDVRDVNDQTFKLNKYRSYSGNPQKLVEELYLNK